MALAVIVVGLGTIGKTWLNDYAARLPDNVFVHAAANSKRLWRWPLPSDWQQQTVSMQVQSAVVAEISKLCDSGHSVAVLDLTASKEVSRNYLPWIEAGAHIISANKYAGSSHPEYYQQLRDALEHHQRYWLYNTTVGAGLPIQKAIRERLDCYDAITAMEGNFSGSLSWIFQQYRPGDKLSEWLCKAADIGYTEPDPRIDLSGMDVARKLLILARDAGWSLQLADVTLHNLVPTALQQIPVASFWQQLDEFDQAFEHWRLQHYPTAQQFCYIGHVQAMPDGSVKATAQLQPIGSDSPYAHLPPGNANFIIRSRQYQQNPLVIQGPGAGPEVTAAGVQSDILELLKLL
ncbi:homoserine dehydrogenase [Pseudidiomarina maritima]|uniref:homoserine dehydrogenase n=1 Tax=Pseudidiomarina maritima TaxID=519453 RepID=A0A1I6H6D3_9GAMM|nr:hypothetical protein [Pseudidiomarina maritima]SFR49930.1 homoserine dehydrogenase [Pseudidiomarina maritima]